MEKVAKPLFTTFWIRFIPLYSISMKNSFTLLVAFLFLVSCEEEVPCKNFVLGEPVEINLGGTVRHCSEDISITYAELISDSRCPTNAICVWQGILEVKITANILGNESTILLSSEPNFGDKIPDSIVIRGFQIKLENALPYPELGLNVKDKDRSVILVVQKVEA